MIITERYAARSSASMERGSLGLNLAADLNRSPVHLRATIRNGKSYARLMLSLHALVTSDMGRRRRDLDAYFAWVQQRYLDDLPLAYLDYAGRLPGLVEQRAELQERVTELQQQVATLVPEASKDFLSARQRYWSYLHERDFDAWLVLDPVLSVRSDSIVFEAFSQDESSYGRVTIPMTALDLQDEMQPGTTNIDFSPTLGREIARIRSYRPADLYVDKERVIQATAAGAAIEKKIDLPDSWVRGFVQVQSAACLPAIDLCLSAGTVADILSVLRGRRDSRGPRSLRFLLRPGVKPTIVIDPWDIRIIEAEHRFAGRFAGEIRSWGRRRLLVLQDLLAASDVVQIRLLGTGMPSYWALQCGGMRFDVGLSGWTRNDWAKMARFDSLAAHPHVSSTVLQQVEQSLGSGSAATSSDIGQAAGISRQQAAAALQELCRRGRAMYDFVAETYRWRELLPPGVAVSESKDSLTTTAASVVRKGGVHWESASRGDEVPEWGRPGTVRVADVRAGHTSNRVRLKLDADGRVVYAQCSCYEFRKNRLRHGPCLHILAATLASADDIAS